MDGWICNLLAYVCLFPDSCLFYVLHMDCIDGWQVERLFALMFALFFFLLMFPVCLDGRLVWQLSSVQFIDVCIYFYVIQVSFMLHSQMNGCKVVWFMFMWSLTPLVLGLVFIYFFFCLLFGDFVQHHKLMWGLK